MPDFVPVQFTIHFAFVFILLGFVGLIWSADRFVIGAAAIAKSYGIAPLVIGLTIVSFGTSAPEVAVSIDSSIIGKGDLAVGNAIGSNLANIGLVLGCTLLIAAIPVKGNLLRNEMPILLGLSVLTGVFLYNGYLGFWEGLCLLLLIFPVMYYLIRQQQIAIANDEEIEIEGEDLIQDLPRSHAIGWFLLGLLVLIVSSRILVMGAATTAEHFGVSTLVIGLTVIAIGTSLPELAASVMSALKGHHDIAIGNIVGSNIFNLLMVLSLPGLIHPPSLGNIVFIRDYMFMMGVTLLLAAAVFIVIRRKKPILGRITGLLLLLVYISYYLVLGFAQS